VRRDPEYGEMIRVLSGVFSERPEDIDKLVAAPELYVVFFPFGAALRQEIISAVSSAPIPAAGWRERAMRRPGGRAKDGRILNWVVSEGGRDRVVKELSESERKLSIATIVNDTLLIDRIASGWLPEVET
jgi:hypothetical protein